MRKTQELNMGGTSSSLILVIDRLEEAQYLWIVPSRPPCQPALIVAKTLQRRISHESINRIARRFSPRSPDGPKRLLRQWPNNLGVVVEKRKYTQKRRRVQDHRLICGIIINTNFKKVTDCGRVTLWGVPPADKTTDLHHL